MRLIRGVGAKNYHLCTPCLHQSVTFKLRPLHVADPNGFIDQQQFLEQISEQASYTFFSTFQARLIGTIVGNILAGVAFKVLVDIISDAWRKWQDSSNNINVSKPFQPPMPIDTPPPPAVPKISTDAWFKLLLCVLIDAGSDASFLFPGIGELEDVAWAPISAFALKYLFESDAVAIAEFTKEILPFTDIIPFATSVWLLENVFITSPFAKILNLKNSRSKTKDDDK